MQLEQQFTIPTGISHAWDLLVDVERIAPCFPGAKVLSVENDTVEGQVKVKLGPVMLTYAGILKFLERDEAARRLVMDGQGTDAKGNGSASARVTAQLVEKPDGSTECKLLTDLNVTGRPAQFGRGMMLEIGNNILGKFSTNLAAMLSAEQPPTSETDPAASVDRGVPMQATPPADTAQQRKSRGVHAASEEEHLDLLKAAGRATAKRLVPAVAVAVVIVAAIIWAIGK
jgi:carbon monoxide dehydrogenase subunit G